MTEKRNEAEEIKTIGGRDGGGAGGAGAKRRRSNTTKRGGTGKGEKHRLKSENGRNRVKEEAEN